jgi:hypothetical protein
MYHTVNPLWPTTQHGILEPRGKVTSFQVNTQVVALPWCNSTYEIEGWMDCCLAREESHKNVRVLLLDPADLLAENWELLDAWQADLGSNNGQPWVAERNGPGAWGHWPQSSSILPGLTNTVFYRSLASNAGPLNLNWLPPSSVAPPPPLS